MQTVRMKKEYTCGELRGTDAGKEVTLMGWVNRRRDHGGLIFIDLRDRDGLTQVIFNPSESALAHLVASEARSEYVLAVQGRVDLRPAGTENPKMKTGEIEIIAQSAEVLNPSKTPPFYISEPSDVDESVRLRYRYLDLRRPRMQRNIVQRHRIIKFIRDFLDARGFLEIETPMLIKSTPEGARDYLVPSRLYPGKFYALPQSPQQLKQLLMVAGFEKYFQIARCFRDEDLRADRQPEFTQLDLEWSFIEEEDILALIESLYTSLAEQLSGKTVLSRPFPRLSFAEAMERYGSDKPDLRFEMPLVDISGIVAQSGFKVFSSTVAEGGQVKGLRVPGAGEYTRKQLDDLTAFVRQFGAPGLVWIAVESRDKGLEGIRSAISKFLTEEEARKILQSLEAGEGDLLLFVAAQPKIAADTLGRLRLEMGRRLGLLREDVLAFAWILDPPLFEWDEETRRFDSAHHPFTSPKDSDIPLLDTAPGQARAKAYDLVANGYELGSGSIRVHRRELQEKIFAVLGYGPEETEERFGHLLTAFEYGAPPHGGIAIGLDRVAMIWSGEDTIRDVIAFPKTQSAVDLMLGSPSSLPESQLRDLHLKVTE